MTCFICRVCQGGGSGSHEDVLGVLPRRYGVNNQKLERIPVTQAEIYSFIIYLRWHQLWLLLDEEDETTLLEVDRGLRNAST